jgi:hypothetical protein
MPVNQIVIDTSEWTTEMIEVLLGDVHEMERALKLKTSTRQPKEFAQKYIHLMGWHAKWELDTRKIVEDTRIPHRIRTAIRRVGPYNTKNNWRYGFRQWVEPGINGLDHPYNRMRDGVLPPSFPEMLEWANRKGTIPIYGIGPKSVKDLFKILVEGLE